MLWISALSRRFSYPTPFSGAIVAAAGDVVGVSVLVIELRAQLLPLVFSLLFGLKGVVHVGPAHIIPWSCRSPVVTVRKQYVALVDGVRNGGGVVHVFSSLHVSGERTSLHI